jgi:tetratricopeptide (TPR) repeat protein
MRPWGVVIASVLLALGARAQDGLTVTPPPECPSPVDEGRRREAEAAFRAGQKHSSVEDWTQAEERFREAIARDPTDPLASYGLGQALMAQKRYPEAVRAFESCREGFRCLTLVPPEERAALERRRDAAINEIRDALRTMEVESMRIGSIKGDGARDLNQDLSQVRAQTSRRVGLLEERLHELEQWRRRGSLDGRPPAALSLALGSAHFQAGQLDEAESAYRAALQTDPRSGDAHNNLAVVLMLTRRLDEAEREVTLAEKAGVPVNPRLKDEIRKRRAAP